MMLALQIYGELSSGGKWADLTGRLHPPGGGLRFTTNAHGFATLEAPFVPMALAEAFEVYEWPGTPRVVVSDYASAVVWEGRLEDIAIADGGVSLRALGYQRAYSDAPYTALWSRTSTADWKEVTEDQRSNASPKMYEMDNNNRLYIAPRKGETFSFALTDVGELSYAGPHGGARNIVRFSADYAVLLPAGWKARVLTDSDNFAMANTEWALTATGSLQTGSINLTTTAARRLIWSIANDTGAADTITEESGELYAKLTNIRIKTTASGLVSASEIAAALAAWLDALNTSQVYSGDELIETTTTDLKDELYEDLYPADILNRLAFLHGYEWSVWKGRRLSFRPKGSGGRQWFVDALALGEVQRSLENVRNNAYGVYRSADGRTLRTAAAGDDDSRARYGLTRRGNVSAETTSLEEAEMHRDLWLSDHALHQARAAVSFDRLYDANGSQWPLYWLRAGDTLTLRNLSPTVSPAAAELRSFRVGETSFDALAGVMEFTPEEATRTLDRLIARRGAGL